MLTDKGISQTLFKLERFTHTLADRLFPIVGDAELLGLYETTIPLDEIPDKSLFSPAGARYGGHGVYGWFRLRYIVPAEVAGHAFYLMPCMGFYEATLWVNGQVHSNFAAKHLQGSHGNHWCNRISEKAEAGEVLDMALECYCFHHTPGSQPFSKDLRDDWTYPTGPVHVCVRDERIHAFLFDLMTVLSLVKALPETSLRRAEVENALEKAHRVLFYDPDLCSRETFYEGLSQAQPILTAVLATASSSSASYVGLVGHSHMDTAWQWPISETVKKCIRTYANQLNLMAEYPEYRFVQSSAFHAELIRRHNPDLFARLQAAIREGRWEPNGGVWVECDCNLTGGEYLVRQFVWGQRYTRQFFGYTADCFWLPDTFGYSCAIPQIMLGCGVRYFLTTKIAWNDTNLFPATTFYWQGLDGSRVLTHFNRTHIGPSPETLVEITTGSDGIREKRASGMRLLSFGKGDGGGGPEFEMLEMARRLHSLDGMPRSGYTSVSDFMQTLEKDVCEPTVYAGELYLELHRGTLTGQHEIKRGNRLLEQALHSLEAALVLEAVRDGKAASEEKVNPLMETLLVRQFHDILPGTCIAPVHAETRRVVADAIHAASTLIRKTLRADTACGLSLYNPLSFPYTDTVYLQGEVPASAGCIAQSFTSLNGEICTALHGLVLPPYSVTPLPGSASTEPADCPFTVQGDIIHTPFADITLDVRGGLSSVFDLREKRELVEGLPFGTFLMTENVPAAWDNWDLDPDEEDKFRPVGEVLAREIVSIGPVELRIRETVRLSSKTLVRQDIVFSAFSPRIAFDVSMDTTDDHRFIKVAFDTAMQCDGVHNEVQFGCIRRSNHRSTSVEKARFEVCNHRYSDLSETDFGIALLNDCKYGLSVREGSMRLSLHKGGLRPDDRGDHGVHTMRYAILPHVGGFSAETVVQPAYAFNLFPICLPGSVSMPPLVKTDTSNVIIETVKPCEDSEHAYMLRMYEAVGSRKRVHLHFSHPVKKLCLCNMLEEEEEVLDSKAPVVMTPFHIATLKVFY